MSILLIYSQGSISLIDHIQNIQGCVNIRNLGNNCHVFEKNEALAIKIFGEKDKFSRQNAQKPFHCRKTRNERETIVLTN